MSSLMRHTGNESQEQGTLPTLQISEGYCGGETGVGKPALLKGFTLVTPLWRAVF